MALFLAIMGCTATPLQERQSADFSMRMRGEVTGAEPLFGTKGWVKVDSKWPSSTIPVCWEALDASQAVERGWVEDAVAKAWPHHSAVRFTGWKLCAPGVAGIHVSEADYVARTLGFGKEVNGVPGGVRLNFKLKRWNVWCLRDAATRESCIRANAVHEFGHALGFVHEHNRHDRPDSCNAVRDANDGDQILTPWDPVSVMNYCNTDRLLAGGRLSDGDETAIGIFYPGAGM